MISQTSAKIIEFTNYVFDIANNCIFYYGDLKSCQELEFTNDRYLALDIGGYNEHTN